MTKITKNLLIISVVCLALGLAFVTGIIDVQKVVALYVALPAGAIVFGLFLIFKMLEKESSLYDEEQQNHPAFRTAAATCKIGEKSGYSGEARKVAAVRH